MSDLKEILMALTLPFAIGAVFIYLKIIGFLNWSWFFILMPFWLPFAIIIGLWIFLAIAAVLIFFHTNGGKHD